MNAETLHIEAGRGYDIIVSPGALSHAGKLIASAVCGRSAAVVTDSNVGPLYAGMLIENLSASGIAADVFTFEAGEPSKSHATLMQLYAFLSEKKITRRDLVIALGGGVAGDLAGFAAATWQRGVDFVQIPTTLLAQVDSSIGGKTGIDLPEGKNLVGAFWQPRLVLCDPQVLKTLSKREYACGMAEVIKHACICSRPLFDELSGQTGNESSLQKLLLANLRIKRDIVQRDEYELGERMLLNFGHTPGHAVEKLTGYSRYSHGETVAIGMVLMALAGEQNGLTEPGTAEELRRKLSLFGLPRSCPLPLEQVVSAMAGDKKRAGADISLVLLKRIGESFIKRLPVAQLPSFFGI